MKVLIIGGVAAGMSVAAKLSRIEPEASIKVFEHGPDVSYGACGLPYFVSGLNPNPELMRIRSVAEFEASGIEVAMGSTVVKVDPQARKITSRHAQSGQETEEAYDKLVIATGANPIVPNLPGIDLANIYTLKTIPDAESIRSALLPEKVKNVVIIGAGYIGMEMVESCVLLGKKVRVVEMKDQALPPMDKEFAQLAQDEAEKHGVEFNLGEAVTGFSGKASVQQVLTDKGAYPADLVLLCIGVSPNTRFMRDTGLDMLPNGAIITDQKMRTNIADIYAAGDCSTVWHKLLNKPVYLPLGTNANKQGRALALSMLDKGPGFPGALGTAVLRVLDLEMGRTGISEAEAIRNNLEYATSQVKVMDLPPYFPGPTLLHIKLTYHPQTKVIMGAQIAGTKGAVGRVATMAAVVDRQMTIQELNDLDLPYAPPFSMVWDALHVAGGAAK